MPRWSGGRMALLGDAAFAVSLIAGKGATLALAGAVVLADALADNPGAIEAAFATYEARLRPWSSRRSGRRGATPACSLPPTASSCSRAMPSCASPRGRSSLRSSGGS